ncbi:AbrB family transcriptional regulator [Alkalicoccus daliensis]|uniref:AbrB family transcriptional regulator n=1 Tax=Alkalicoccus daliensis TaxID=745820 RepID=A0A1H0FY59_9BACI|nr:AbrB family transcriptional regulator [Alkalicoccus daliensis]SDN99512.1 hypothetical protein SAMN04488053_105147 [Alkalicoccus daliensis]
MHIPAWKNTLKAIGTGAAGGGLFTMLQLPLPWLLGALVSTSIWKHFSNVPAPVTPAFRNIAFLMLGIYFALFIDPGKVIDIIPVLPFYLLFTIIIISLCLWTGYFLARKLLMQKLTGVLGLVPGAPSAVILMSDSLHANTPFILLLHSLRKIIVLFTVPFVLFLFFVDMNAPSEPEALVNQNMEGSYWWYAFALAFSTLYYLNKNLFLAGPPVIMGSLIFFGVDPAPYPEAALAAAHLFLGTYLGSKLKLTDMKQSGAPVLWYTGAVLLLITLSAGFGLLLSAVTSVDQITAVMSLMPGGLLEVGIIAAGTGGDPGAVLMLQFVRFLIIFYGLPPLLFWYFSRKQKVPV